jgi:hypothetical protein
VCRDNRINKILGVTPISYKEALEKAFNKIESNDIISSWKDSYSSSGINFDISEFIEVPTFGCFIDKRSHKIIDYEQSVNRIWSIGGESGWYYANWMWKFRGFLDKVAGGVGLRRGRTNLTSINAGDTIDFWRVLYVDKNKGRLLLFAEMKLPGEAWLEFKIVDDKLIQTATFRPLGLLGRLYWYTVLPLHGVVFRGLLRSLSI